MQVDQPIMASSKQVEQKLGQNVVKATLLLVTLLVSVGIVGAAVALHFRNKNQPVSKPEIIVLTSPTPALVAGNLQPTVKVAEATLAAPTTAATVTAVTKDVLYLGKYQEKQVLFYEPYAKKGEEQPGLSFGVVSENQGFAAARIDFAQITDAKAFMQFTDQKQYSYVDFFMFDQHNLFISVLNTADFLNENKPINNDIYRFDLTTGKSTLVRSKLMTSGPVTFDSATTDQYLVLEQLPCWYCGPEQPTDILVYNIQTQKEINLSMAANIVLDQTKVKYQLYLETTERPSCNTDECNNTFCAQPDIFCTFMQEIVWKVGGEVKEQSLP